MKQATLATAAAARRERPAGLAVSAVLIAKPGIVGGVVLSGLAGMTLAGRSLPSAQDAAVGLAAIVLAASGSAVMNGVLDSRMDAGMERLSERVAAMGRVGRRTAVALSLVLIGAGLLLSLLFLNPVAALLVLCAVLGYTVLYTLFLKRRSPYGTIPGGVPGALPVLIGYSAVNPRLGPDAILLFLVVLLWQPPHFWALALARQDDYRNAGVPVLPVAFGESYTRILMFLYALALLPLSLGLWALGYCSGFFAAGAAALWLYFVGACYVHAVRARRFGKAFAASIVYVVGTFAALIADVAVLAAR